MTSYLRPFGFLILLVLFAGQHLHAQREVVRCPQGIDGIIQIHLRYKNNQSVDQQFHVDLTNETGQTLSTIYTDTSGYVKFHVTSNGRYYAKISGPGIENVTSESIDFETLEETCRDIRTSYVYLKPTGEAAQSAKPQSASKGENPTVTSAAELRVPQSARKAFDQGLSAWQKKDYKQAAENFEKAVAEYPQYDTAYNNLGVMYAHLGQDDKAMAAFKRAVELNDKNADADRNLARLLIRQKDYPQAEELLKKSLTVEPAEASTLTMLVMAEAQDGKLDDAVKDAQKVHSLPHEGYAVVHYIAGEVLEEKHQYADATTEYNLYLKEAPNGPEAAQVKSALERIPSSGASAVPKSQ